MTYQFSINIQDFEDLPDPQTKAELLQRMALTYQAAESLIAALDQSALIKPLIESGWSIKDHLAHLTTWEYGMVALFQKIDRFQAMGVDPATANNDDMNTINDAMTPNLLHVNKFFL